MYENTCIDTIAFATAINYSVLESPLTFFCISPTLKAQLMCVWNPFLIVIFAQKGKRNKLILFLKKKEKKGIISQHCVWRTGKTRPFCIKTGAPLHSLEPKMRIVAGEKVTFIATSTCITVLHTTSTFISSKVSSIVIRQEAVRGNCLGKKQASKLMRML